MSLKTKKFLSTIEILLLVMITFSPLISTWIKVFLTFALMLISCRVLMKENNGDIPIDRTIIIAMIFFTISMVYDMKNALGGQPYSLVNFLYPCYFLCGYLVAKRYSRSQFYDILEKVTFVLAVLSLVGMSVYFINPSWIYSFPQYVQNGKPHRTILIFNYLFSGDWMAVRNSGIAWEPGAFQILLNLAFQIAIQKLNGKKLFVRFCVYSVAVILTRSTIGYVILVINLISLMIKHKKYIPFLSAVFVGGMMWIIPELQYQIQYKLFGSSAFSARFDPLINAIKYVWYMPLGLGSTGYDAVYEAEKLGSFDCYTQILLRCGYPMLIYVIGRLFKIFFKDNKYMGIILIISFLSEPIWGFVLITAMYYLEDKNTVGGLDGKVCKIKRA